MYPIIYRWMTDEPWAETHDPDRLDLLPVWARPLAPAGYPPPPRRQRSIRMRISALVSDLRRRSGAATEQGASRPVAGLTGCDTAEPCW
jgi:hypothetical protein